jgi:hypothetical protein
MEVESMSNSTLGVRIDGSAITVSDPEHPSVPETAISFQRTLRIPDDTREWPLPPGLGEFPLRTVTSLADRATAAMRERGGVVLPMYQAEAMWISFAAPPLAADGDQGRRGDDQRD